MMFDGLLGSAYFLFYSFIKRLRLGFGLWFYPDATICTMFVNYRLGDNEYVVTPESNDNLLYEIRYDGLVVNDVVALVRRK